MAGILAGARAEERAALYFASATGARLVGRAADPWRALEAGHRCLRNHGRWRSCRDATNGEP